MTRRGLLGFLSAAGASVFVGACGDRDGSIRYKMTVEIDTPQGIRSGYAVREIRYSENGPGPLGAVGESKPSFALDGEAVVVDLGNGQSLFALLVGRYGQLEHASHDMWFLLKNRDLASGQTLELWPTLPKESSRVSDYVPMLVTFDNFQDPQSIRAVSALDLVSFFGSGNKLRRIVLTLSNEPVTVGIEQRLPWLLSHRGSFDFDGHLHPGTPEKDVTVKAFKQRFG